MGNDSLIYKENPVAADNAYITEQLLGKNSKNLAFIALDCIALRDNELVDPWNTPYFFHARTSQEIDVYSAGPDKQLWTDDDLVYPPRNPNTEY